jgi:hypothetical protein
MAEVILNFRYSELTGSGAVVDLSLRPVVVLSLIGRARRFAPAVL